MTDILATPFTAAFAHEYGLSFCASGKAMFAVSQSSIQKQLVRLRLSTVVGGMLVAWLAAYAVAASAKDVLADSGMVALAGDQQREFLQTFEKSWLSHTNVSRWAQAAVVNPFLDQSSSAEPGSYFRTLTRIYGASTTEYSVFVQESHASSMDEPLPMDEVARFHQMETHMPIARMRITSEFGHRSNPVGKGHAFHRGIDLAAPVGTPVYAVAAGTVIRASSDRNYGNVVVINHHNGYQTLYAHHSRLQVKAGERVKAGQSIAQVGSTGRSAGAHLHFEMHCSGDRVDPGPYLAAL